MATLPDDVYGEIQRLCGEGDRIAEAKRYADANNLYKQAWDLLPEPKTEWEAATWILAAIGDASYLAGDYERCRQAMQNAMHCLGGIGNPFLHLRLGQSEFELGNPGRAADELARAYMGGGTKVFQCDDGKCLAFVKTVLAEPEGGW
jgi:hypothetical protein